MRTKQDKEMKKKLVATMILMFSVRTAVPQGAMIVEDPAAIMQSATSHAESFGEMLTQTSVFLEDLQLQYDQINDNLIALADKVAAGVRVSKKSIYATKKMKSIISRLEWFRKYLRKSEDYTPEEKVVFYAAAYGCCKYMINNWSSMMMDMKDAENITKDDKKLLLDNHKIMDRIIACLDKTDNQMAKVIYDAELLVQKKRRFINETKYVNGLFGIKY